MDQQAKQLNEIINSENPHIYRLLSDLGKRIYFPKEGILNQAAQSAKEAYRYDATIGIATEGPEPMHLSHIQELFNNTAPKNIYPYAPPSGKLELRRVWKDKLLIANPSLESNSMSLPLVTQALTHGLSIVADLFVDQGNQIILPDKYWENYDLIFSVRRQSVFHLFPFYNNEGTGLNVSYLQQVVANLKGQDKAIFLFNFPNNPTGYTLTAKEQQTIESALFQLAEQGTSVLTIMDDAYFGLFYEDSVRESLFASLSKLHPNLLAIKIDGATKEDYAWGFRVGFLTFGHTNANILRALEEKATGMIRSVVSSCSHPAQTILLQAFQHPAYEASKKEKYEILKARAKKVKDLLHTYHLEYYPFNSGYFMCLKLPNIPSEDLRTHLLKHYGIGTIAPGSQELRIAFSCIEEKELESLFSYIKKAIEKF